MTHTHLVEKYLESHPQHANLRYLEACGARWEGSDKGYLFADGSRAIFRFVRQTTRNKEVWRYVIIDNNGRHVEDGPIVEEQ